MKLSPRICIQFTPDGELHIAGGEGAYIALTFTRQEVARLHRALSARAAVSVYLTRQRAKRAAKSSG